ncbi:hypothetical protein cand_005990 [Cryptosporidium andersoni]|uniref:Major facilitator superfamily protein n=1 Tax=Cryptosporidium andersoni TaxID=117008 RepID=A0A1J4MPL8_9CRYT|nr:hypothetical protein cand_005990 [Cryptosporidium andersoni]
MKSRDRIICNRWILLCLYLFISIGVCGIVASYTAILPLLRKACILTNFCRCDPSSTQYSTNCEDPENFDVIVFSTLQNLSSCNPLGCNIQNLYHNSAWKVGLSTPLIISPIAGTIADIVGPRTLGVLGSIVICAGLLIWMLLASSLSVHPLGPHLLSTSWFFLGIGRVCISYSIVSISSLFSMQSLVISIIGGLIDAAILLPLFIGHIQIKLSSIVDEYTITRLFIYIYIAAGILSFIILLLTLPTVTFDKIKFLINEEESDTVENKLIGSKNILQIIYNKAHLKKGCCNLAIKDFEAGKSKSVDLTPRLKMNSIRSKTAFDIPIDCYLQNSSAIMGGYSVVCSLANCSKNINYMSCNKSLPTLGLQPKIKKTKFREIYNVDLYEQIFSCEYFVFLVLFVFNFWRSSILVSKSEYIVSLVLSSNQSDVSLIETLPRMMNIYNSIMSMGSIFSIFWGVVATRYGVSFMIGVLTLLGCFVHIILLFLSQLPFFFLYIYFGTFAALRSFIFGALNCFIGDTFGFRNFARLAGTQAFVCFVFFQIMNITTSKYVDTLSWGKINQLLMIINIILLPVPLILNAMRNLRS